MNSGVMDYWQKQTNKQTDVSSNFTGQWNYGKDKNVTREY